MKRSIFSQRIDKEEIGEKEIDKERRANTRIIKRIKLITIFIVSMLVLSTVNRFSTSYFQGTDDQGKSEIERIAPKYSSWFQALWEAPSKPVENLLFGVQGAAGVTFIAYFIGKKKNVKNN